MIFQSKKAHEYEIKNNTPDITIAKVISGVLFLH